MGKTGKNIKRRRLQEQLDHAGDDLSVPGTPVDTTFLLGLVSPSDLAITIRTLKAISENTELLANKNDLKGLRGAVFDFQRISANQGSSLTSRISAALSSSRHTDAQVLLAELRIRKLVPKLGSLQRWVRDCDAASRSDGSYGDAEVLRVLDAVLRSTVSEEVTEGNGEGPVRRMEEWSLKEGSGVDLFGLVRDGLLPLESEREALKAPFRLRESKAPLSLPSLVLEADPLSPPTVQHTPGPDRLPPNHHAADLWTSTPSAIPLSLTPSEPTTFHPVPNVPGAFLLSDVLSLSECRAIIASAEAIGFEPDRPVGDGAALVVGESVLAHNFYWLADSEFLGRLWDRVKGVLPATINSCGLAGLNARFRVYRYVPGAIYRPHIDGAWPASGIDPTTGEYLYDSSPRDKPQWSRLTFLLYLNDSFPGGCTTFFLPALTSLSPSSPVLNAYPVKPIAGSALVFPHGDAKGSLLHEGSPVGEGGGKYVIRTDVLYYTGPGKPPESELEV